MVIPSKLKPGDEVRIIAPARSLAIVSKQICRIANKRLADLGLKISFGKHVLEQDELNSSSVKSRVADLHQAFTDKNVKAILTVIGGYNCNQILDNINWNLIKNNPKIFCGYSDITILNNAIFAKTGLVTYYGPHYSTFGQEKYFDYTLEYFTKCLFQNKAFKIKPSKSWSDDLWFKNQNKRKLIPNKGWLIINKGKAQGTALGGNLCTFNLLQGTKYMPSLVGSVLFLEDDELAKEYSAVEFDRNLQSIVQQPDFKEVKGLVLGRFQKASKMGNNIITKIIKSKPELSKIPVIANVDFGHTDPKITIPIGGKVLINTNTIEIKI